VNAVTKALSEIDGVSNVTVNLSSGEATFEEARPVSSDVIAEKVKKAGFEIG
jgi:copper chaperone CopZ